MEVNKYLTQEYPVAGPYDGINSVEERLLKYRYIVVADSDKTFYGILTPSDIIEHPHKIVIDCVTKKEALSIDENIFAALNKFRSSRSLALPVTDKGSFVGVVEKEHLITAMQAKINQLYEKSEVSEKAKTYFLNNLSHEIRTPMNGIVGFIDLISLMDTSILNFCDKKMAEVVRISADRFLLVINDLIELSLIQSGDNIVIRKELVSIERIFAELNDYFNESIPAKKRGVVLLYSNQHFIPYVFTDEKRLKHILYHLIDNAIKFSENNRVVYGYKPTADKKGAEFFVINKSRKLSENDKAKVFEIFEKQENIGSNFNSGLGIGLPIAKRLTELIGGQIGVQSDNKQTIFSITIPIE